MTDDRVSYGRPYMFIIGGIVHAQETHALSFNIEELGKNNSFYPSYDKDDLKNLLKVRSKAFIALERGDIKETVLFEDPFCFRVWHLKNDIPMVIPSDVIDAVKALPKGEDIGTPVAIKVVRRAVQHQPVQIWILSNPEEDSWHLTEVRNKLTSWINVSKRWWLEAETKSPKLKNLVISSLHAQRV